MLYGFCFLQLLVILEKEKKSGAALKSRFVVFSINFCCTCFDFLLLERIAKEK